MAKLRTGTLKGEPTPQSYFEDIGWIRANRHSLVEQYGDCYIIVHDGQVLGTGQTYQEALASAEQNTPAKLEGTIVAYDYITLKPRFTGYLRKQKP